MKRSRFRDLRRSLRYLRPHAAPISLVLVLTLLVGGLTASEPLAYKAIFDALSVPGSPPLAAAVPPLVALLGIVIGRQLLEATNVLVTWRVRLKINREILSQATARLHTLPLAYHQGRGVGETMTRLDRGVTSFMEALTLVAFHIVPAVVYLAVSLAIMVVLSPPLAALAVVFLVPPLLLGGAAASELVERERVVLDRWCRIYNRFHQVLQGIKTVKAFAREQDEHRRFVESVSGAQRAVLRNVRLQTGLATGRGLCVNLGRVAVLGAGAILLARGEIGPGTLVAFLGYVGGLYAPAQQLLGALEAVRRAELGLEAVYGVLDAEDAVPDAPGAVSPAVIQGEVELRRVTFRHDPTSTDRPALDQVSLHIAPGELVALVGPSGAGKTTLADLLLRLHDPTAGEVLLDGRDLRTLSQQALRRRLGVVTQEPFLFEDTLLANIGYGRAGASRADIEAAAVAAQADAFIRRLPDGYHTRVGRGGVALSGGERQRIAIARTLLKDPALVLLDEPTSSLDIESDLAVLAGIDRLAAGRTTILIAHRLPSTLRADRVVVLDAGRVVEDGAPRELLERGGAYARLLRLWQAQTPSDAPPSSLDDALPLSHPC